MAVGGRKQDVRGRVVCGGRVSAIDRKVSRSVYICVWEKKCVRSIYNKYIVGRRKTRLVSRTYTHTQQSGVEGLWRSLFLLHTERPPTLSIFPYGAAAKNQATHEQHSNEYCLTGDVS